MDVLLLSQEPPLRADEVVSGNAVRCRQLTRAMEASGHRVATAWLSKARRQADRHHEFRNPDELQAIISRTRPGAVVVGYWELLELLPYDLPCPVCLDFVAPRPLEQLFEAPETVRRDLRRLGNALRRSDLVLVGNNAQRHLLLYTLIEAGFDLREGVPVVAVPLGATPAPRSPNPPGDGTWTVVTGGVRWPWRVGGDWDEALVQVARSGRVRVEVFGGRYRLHEDETGEEPTREKMPGEAWHYRDLEPYEDFSAFLSSQAHIGLELANHNVEREFSQSFRSLEFLRHGLPLVCNRYLPIAALIGQYDAGWLVDDASELENLFAQILADPAAWQEKSANALRLVSEALSPERTAAPLCEWLGDPRPATRLPEPAVSSKETPVLGVPPLGERLRRQWRLVRQFLLPRLLGMGALRDKAPETEPGSGVLIVTRGDLFPADHGAAVRTMETAFALARQGIRTGLVTDERAHWYEVRQNGVKRRRIPWRLRLLSLPAPLCKLLHHSKDIPHSDSFLYLPLSDNSYYWRILAAARHVRPAVLQAEFPAYARPCLDAAPVLRCGVVLVEHNVEYDRLQAQLPELTPSQYRNLRDLELDFCRRSDAVVCVSDNDRRALEAAGVPAARLHTIPHGVNLAAFDDAEPKDVRGPYGIEPDAPLLVFHGAYSYPPNREALRIMAETILPGLEETGLRAHLLAIGRDPPQRVPHPRMHFPGSVPELAPWLKAADIAVIPLAEGGGTRMKILDCFAARLPVVSTAKGIEGIPVAHGREALIIDAWQEFIQAVAELWHDRERAAELAGRGRAFAESLDWEEIARRYARLYQSAAR